MKREDVVDLVDRASVSGLGYLLLLMLLRSATVAELKLITRDDRGVIGQRLAALEMRGFVMRVAAGHADRWYPSEVCAGLVVSERELPGPSMRSATVENLDSCGPTTAAALSIPALQPEAVAEASATVEKIDSKSADPFAGIEPELLFAFRRAGIGSNMWQELAAKEWIDADYVRGHDEYRRSRGESVGLLITRLRCGDAVPDESLPADDLASQWARVLGRK